MSTQSEIDTLLVSRVILVLDYKAEMLPKDFRRLLAQVRRLHSGKTEVDRATLKFLQSRYYARYLAMKGKQYARSKVSRVSGQPMCVAAGFQGYSSVRKAS